MPTQHPFLPQHLALAIALALGCAEVSMAQSVAEKTRPFETTAEMQARLKVFAAAPDTNIQRVIKVQEAPLSKDDSNDLVLVSRQGELIGLTDGGGGANVLQLDIVKGGELGEIRNFQDLYLKRGEWSNDRAFDSSSLIDSNAKLINTGDIRGAMHVLGELVNRGTVAGPVFVGKKARFSGSGTVDALDVDGLMEVNPVAGAPLVINDLKLSKSATLIYGLDAEKGNATIKVGGTATLGNATLKITSVPGEYIDTSKRIVIEAEDKVEGKFGKVVNELAFLNATPDYTVEKQVGLIFERNKVPTEEIATSENGRKVVNVIQELQPDMPLPPAAEQNSNRPTSKPTEPPKVVVSAKPKPVVQVHAIKPAPKPNAAINALLGTNLTTAADAIDQLGGYNTADLGNATLSSIAPISTGMLSAMSRRSPADGYDNGQVWVQAIGNSGSLAKQLGNFALKHSTKGLMLGTDWAVSPDWRLGIIGSKTQTRMDSYQFDGALDSWLAGAYALRQEGPLALRLGAVYGSHDGSTKRHVAFNGFRDRLKGRYDATTQQIFGQVGYNLDIAHFDIEPYVQVGYQRYQRDAYTEKGGDAALQYDGQAQEHYSSDLGLRLARTFALDQGMRLTPRLDVGWKHLYGNVRGSSHQRLVRGGNTYIIEGIELDRDSLLLEAGLDLAVSPRHTFGLSYSGETGQDNRNGALMGQWRMMF
ncbi:autotransporter outer membrane beta-barrel domain-containing protein [Pseudomonas ogarae]|nr:autotransporter outer membrane beta-barrel domain-containing protein [Pseudomonas ogarae]OPG73183.1 autotransporter outer membrane beta-barrel domain-containing protein [Pseudomonas ogarae]OPG78751.1 autotransporter outer membrane beta-barrel domain-containing protein [Pseudomonas ogarae]PBJ04125.1 Extracellular serine protease precursor [Pseudomonas ogarae]